MGWVLEDQLNDAVKEYNIKSMVAGVWLLM